MLQFKMFSKLLQFREHTTRIHALEQPELFSGEMEGRAERKRGSNTS